MAPCQSGDPKERMHPAAVLVGGRWISKGVWHEPVSMEAGMKANMPERWRDKKNADGNRFVWNKGVNFVTQSATSIKLQSQAPMFGAIDGTY